MSRDLSVKISFSKLIYKNLTSKGISTAWDGTYNSPIYSLRSVFDFV